VAPAAYQKGPATPYVYATVLLWSSVAAHVHAETMPAAIRPGLTFLLAVLNSSLVLVENCVYLFCRWDQHSNLGNPEAPNTCSIDIPIMAIVKKAPMPTTTP
jgi:hypothetical protein